MLKQDEYVHIVNMEQQDGWRYWALRACCGII